MNKAGHRSRIGRTSSVWAFVSLASWLLLGASSVVWALDDRESKPVTFDNALTVFQARCLSCHNSDKQSGGLVLEQYGPAMAGGASGEVIIPGSLEDSYLWLVVNHEDFPTMPPNSPKIPDNELQVLRRWIEAGAPDSPSAGGNKPSLDFTVDPDTVGKPRGEPALPIDLSTEPPVLADRAPAVNALAHSPWAPLAAVAGHKQVLLYRTDRIGPDQQARLVGVLPFPEGVIETLKFSRNGDLLLAGGGRGGQSGLCVVWDVKTGDRITEVGREYDVVLAGDISPDQSLVALGGPSRVVRVYDTTRGDLVYEIKKHTEWVTAIAFSPDGVLLATGDRNNGLHIWESLTGRPFYDLRGHKAMITGLSWRIDSNVLASASEDRSVKLWSMESGRQIKSFNAHGGGTLDVAFANDGTLATAGRDRMVRLWDQNGSKQRDLSRFDDIALRTVFDHDGQRVLASDFEGMVRLWDLQGEHLADLSANPEPVAQRIRTVRGQLEPARKAAEQAQAELETLSRAVEEAQSGVQAQANVRNAVQASLSELDARLEALQSRREDAQTTRAEVVEQIATIDRKVQATRSEIVQAEQHLSARRTELAQWETRITRDQASLPGRLDAKRSLDGTLDQAVEALTNANGPDDRERLTRRVEDLALRVVQATAEIGTLTRRLLDDRSQLVDSRAEAMRMAQEIAQRRADVEPLLESLSQAQRRADVLSATIAELTADLEPIAQRRREVTDRLEAESAALTALQNELTRSEEQRAQAEPSLQKAIAILDQLREHLRALEAERGDSEQLADARGNDEE